MNTIIFNGNLITPGEPVAGGWVLVEGGRIAAVGSGTPPAADRRIDAAGRFIAPGFIDMHIQGLDGIDLWDESDERFRQAAAAMAATGCTSAVASVDATEEVCRLMRPRVGVATGGARLLGLYFESPFISTGKRGAIPASRVRPPSAQAARDLLRWSAGTLAAITLAPEVPGVMEVLPILRAAAGPAGPVVTAFGHSEATYEQAAAGIEAGLKHCTHLYNAMTGLHHRKPGAVGALLTRPDASVEIVGDGIHVHPAAVRIAVACKGAAAVCLITDASSGTTARIYDGAPRLADGTLAGSILTMDRGVANLRRFAGVTLPEAVEMATLSPARVLGFDRTKGRLAPGYDADVVLFDADVKVSMTMVGGEVVYERAV